MRSSPRSKWSCHRALEQKTRTCQIVRKWAHTKNIWHKQTGSNLKADSDLALKHQVTSSCLIEPNGVVLQSCTCRDEDLEPQPHCSLFVIICTVTKHRMNSHYLERCQPHIAGNSSNWFLVKCGAGMRKKQKTGGVGKGKKRKKKTKDSHAHVKSKPHSLMYQIKLARKCDFLANFAR